MQKMDTRLVDGAFSIMSGFSEQNPRNTAVCIVLVVIYANILFATVYLKMDHTKPLFNDFYYELQISWGFYMIQLCVTLEGTWKNKGTNNNLLGSYISAICIMLAVASFFLPDSHSLLLMRFISWIFAFPFKWLLQFNTLGFNAKQRAMTNFYCCMGGTLVMFIFNLAYHQWPCLLFRAALWGMAVVTLYFQLKVPESIFLHFIFVIYGAVFALYDFGHIDQNTLCRTFILFDVMAKFFYIFLVTLSNEPLFAENLESQKIARFITPCLLLAHEKGLLDDAKVHDFCRALGINGSRGQIPQIAQEIVNELFPVSKLSTVGSLNKSVYHASSCVMFVDLVGFTQVVASTDLTEMVRNLDTIYVTMDLIADGHSVKKVEFIGDCFLVMGPVVNVLRCASSMLSEYGIRIRIGIDAGDVMECVLGLNKVRQGIVGSTVNIAARLESSGIPGKAHVSQAVVDLLVQVTEADQATSFDKVQELVMLKGIGMRQTYFWNGRFLDAKAQS